MSDQPNDGGSITPTMVRMASTPASPDLEEADMMIPRGGLSLRDWFAGMALSSMDYGWFGSSTRIQEMAEESYNIADAMIKERKGENHE